MNNNISDSVKYIGVDDTTIDLFESQYVVPEGVSYNSYVILDEKTAVMDTVDKRGMKQWEVNLLNALDGRKADYVIVQHMEPDHAGSLARLLELYPDITVVGNAKTFVMINQFFENIDIKNTLTNYKTEYGDNDFSAVYDLKSDLNATVLQSINENIMANLDSIVSSTGSQDLFKTVKAEKPGIVVYSVDGYEGITEETIGNVDFKKTAYDKQNLKSEKLIAASDPAYKSITMENWTLMFPVTQSDIDKYSLSGKDTISIKFTKDSVTGTFPFKIVNDGKNSYGEITLSKYMIRYATERFLDIEIIVSGKSGIKVPVSAVTENEFYKIPKEYLITNGEKGNYGFLVEESDSEGKLNQVFKSVDIYKSTDDSIYIKKTELSAGTSIIKMDSSDRFVVGPVEKLKGIYCVNTGYTVFKLVEIIDGNNEYYIVKQSLSHGVSIYDRIILDADKYSENEMIY